METEESGMLQEFFENPEEERKHAFQRRMAELFCLTESSGEKEYFPLPEPPSCPVCEKTDKGATSR